MKKYPSIFLFLILFAAGMAQAAETNERSTSESREVLDWTGKRVYSFEGNIAPHMRGVIDAIGDHQAQRGEERVIRILINSFGGDVTTSSSASLTLIKKKMEGYHVSCVVTQVAASAAARLAGDCDELILVAGAWMMWHPQTPVHSYEDRVTAYAKLLEKTWTSDDEREFMEVSRRIEKYADQRAIRAFAFSPGDYERHKASEDFIPAEMIASQVAASRGGATVGTVRLAGAVRLPGRTGWPLNEPAITGGELLPVDPMEGDPTGLLAVLQTASRVPQPLKNLLGVVASRTAVASANLRKVGRMAAGKK